MRVKNNTSKIIRLINGNIIEPYLEVVIDVDEKLKEQIENLKNMKIVSVRN